jgi:small nuclear ribonucleoprotein D3
MILQDAEGMIVTIETKTGETYRGFLDSAEDCMNCRMYNVLIVRPDGSTMQMDKVFIPGRQIRLAVLPKMLEQAPFFKRVRAKKEGKEMLLGMGRGRHMAAMTRFGKRHICVFSLLGSRPCRACAVDGGCCLALARVPRFRSCRARRRSRRRATWRRRPRLRSWRDGPAPYAPGHGRAWGSHGHGRGRLHGRWTWEADGTRGARGPRRVGWTGTGHADGVRRQGRRRRARHGWHGYARGWRWHARHGWHGYAHGRRRRARHGWHGYAHGRRRRARHGWHGYAHGWRWHAWHGGYGYAHGWRWHAWHGGYGYAHGWRWHAWHGGYGYAHGKRRPGDQTGTRRR